MIWIAAVAKSSYQKRVARLGEGSFSARGDHVHGVALNTTIHQNIVAVEGLLRLLRRFSPVHG
ncbi:hypothetical protein BEL07_08465 [Mycolicibacterium grossiae]|uniref:Transposase n=1 Tax=Mycolicibacterium grossiae TaxID=1552759 RepID=A0A1E8Q6W5_9MYCO|nr:hypothetical protein BEL07_08465 [Mycolicibacterium grossiae]